MINSWKKHEFTFCKLFNILKCCFRGEEWGQQKCGFSKEFLEIFHNQNTLTFYAVFVVYTLLRMRWEIINDFTNKLFNYWLLMFLHSLLTCDDLDEKQKLTVYTDLVRFSFLSIFLLLILYIYFILYHFLCHVFLHFDHRTGKYIANCVAWFIFKSPQLSTLNPLIFSIF